MYQTRVILVGLILLCGCVKPGEHPRHAGTSFPFAEYLSKVDWLGNPSDSTVPYFPDIFRGDSTSNWKVREYARSLNFFHSWAMFHLREPVLSVRPLAVPMFRVIVFQELGRVLVVRAAKVKDSVEIVSKTDVYCGICIPVIDSVRSFHFSSAVWDTLSELADSSGLWAQSAHAKIHALYWRTVWLVEAQDSDRYAFDFADYPIANRDDRAFSLVCLYLLSLGDIHVRPWESFHFNPREAYDWIKEGGKSH